MAAGQRRGRSARALGLSPSLRALAPGGGAASRPPDDRPVLRLAVSKGALAIELGEPFAIGPLRVTELVVRLAGIRFPVDLSGGVARFRHRRGQLVRLVVEAQGTELAGWAAPRLRGFLGDGAPQLIIAPIEDGALVALRSGESALAFDVAVAPSERALRLLPERARGVGLAAPPHALALQALSMMAGPHGRIVEGAIVLDAAIERVVRLLLPAAGARAPAVAGVQWASVVAEAGRFRAEGALDAAPPALGDRALRALEAAELAGAGDELALAGGLDDARRVYLAALERAPRHPEISSRLAWIDLLAGERAEGALSTVVDAMPAVDAGLLGGALLEAVGDRDGAFSALARAAHAEPYGPLAALAWLRAARLADAVDVRLDALNLGVARAPGIEALRWARLEARLDVADVRGALADAEHLEAAARGAEARHAVSRRAAEAFLARGHAADARALFERALRYAPESPDGVAGLARSLRAAGEGRRALDLLARARVLVARSGARGDEDARALDLELGRGLAEIAGDLPAAVARVRAIPPGAPESLEARLLEGRWCAELGDLGGASVALGRLRDAVELALQDRAADPGSARAAGSPFVGGPAAVAALLAEAAEIEERSRGDLLAAQRHLGLALRLRPRDPEIAAAFRRVSGELAPAVAPPRGAGPSRGAEPSPAPRPRATEQRIEVHVPAPPRRRSIPPEPVVVAPPPAPSPPIAPAAIARTPAVTAPIAPAPAPRIAPPPAPPIAPRDPGRLDEMPTFDSSDTSTDLPDMPPVPNSVTLAEGQAPFARALGVDDELLAERLADRLRADPTDHGVAMALADVLERLGRDLDLLALLSARLEEGDEAARQEVAPRRRDVLVRLAGRARAEGRAAEAELYEMLLHAELT
ncbi:tetratricopeptide repeat protein [Sorangium sp. So ce385]|uniref:tetratricopeptide repeat protein n=1 Tax=Sorangium sp. So ce385 TaxID=3133308 RepID=UPI003F5C8600